MRTVTVVVIVGLLVGLGAVAVFGIVSTGDGGDLVEQWVSDTARANEVNHHAIGAGPDGDVLIAPLAEIPHTDTPITDTSCALVRLAPASGTVEWRQGVPAADCFTHALTEPAIEDVDGDGDLEAAVSSTQNALVVHDAATGAEAFRVPLRTYGYGRPTIADVLPAPGSELVTSDISGNVVLATANGTVAWRRSLNRTFGRFVSVWDAPAVADVDADGRTEVVVGTNVGPVVLGPRGRVEWSDRGGASYVAVAEVDGDDAREVFTSQTGSIRAIDGRSHDVQWTRDVGGSAPIRVAADADGDGTVELFVGQADGRAVAMNARTGETVWSTTVSQEEKPLPAPVLGDVDGDDEAEVLTVSQGGTVAVLAAGSGDVLALSERSVPIWTVPTPADLDDDGTDELLVLYGDARVVALAYQS